MGVLHAILQKINLIFFICFLFFFPTFLTCADYISSAHGNSTNGVNRTIKSNFHKGNCEHCHDMHKLDSGPYAYFLFYSPFVNQTDNFCLKCHDGTTTESSRTITNRSYSYRAGGYTSDTISNIKSAFDTSTQTSVHNLDEILTFIQSQSWNFNSSSSPCVACHNPHFVQGDPFNLPNSAKISSSRGYLLSKPSNHGTKITTEFLWGDDSGEKMSDYVSGYLYQSPYRYNSTTTFEPDGSTVTNGSNLTDMNSFCLDCHIVNMQESPYNLTNTPINWDTSGDKHGKNAADNGIDIKAPYSSSNSGDYCLACTDCHEGHGAPNVFLIRKEVNGTVLSGSITDLSGAKMGYLCKNCHLDDAAANGGNENSWQYAHHLSSDAPYTGTCYKRCGACHYSYPIDCNNCHFHGSDDSWLNSRNSSCTTGKKCF